MNERTLIERLNIPWPDHEAEEVTLPAWVLELCAEGAARIAALEAQLAETQEKLIEANDKLIRQNEALFRTGAVKVKPLEWEETHTRRSEEDPTTEWNGGFKADSALGYYEISMGFGSDAYYWAVKNPLGDDVGSAFEDPSYAKAAAQQDYERRILSALEPAATATAAEAVAWVAADTLNSPHPGCISSLAYMSQIDKDTGREYVPLYTRPPESRLREARLREALANLVQDIDDLVSESEGVAGLHLNGDVAEWDDLLPGGPYERLTSLDDARAAFKEADDERS